MPTIDECLFDNLPQTARPNQRFWVKDKAAFYLFVSGAWTVDSTQSTLNATSLPAATSSVAGALSTASVDTQIAASSAITLTSQGVRAGQVTITSPATSATVTFSTPMSAATFAVTLTQNAAIVAVNADVTNKTVNGFDIALSAALTVTYNWIAVLNT